MVALTETCLERNIHTLLAYIYSMGLKEWFGKGKKSEPKAPEQGEQIGQIVSPEELRAAREKIADDVAAQIAQLESAIATTTDPNKKARLEALLAERQKQR